MGEGKGGAIHGILGHNGLYFHKQSHSKSKLL